MNIGESRIEQEIQNKEVVYLQVLISGGLLDFVPKERREHVQEKQVV